MIAFILTILTINIVAYMFPDRDIVIAAIILLFISAGYAAIDVIQKLKDITRK